MKQCILLVLLLNNTNPFVLAQTISNQASNNKEDVAEQPTLMVTDEIPDTPAPLQSEAQKINSWTGSASLTTNEYWQNQRAANIKDILDFIPGVFAQQRNGAESARISIRGSGLGRQFQGGGILLLQDGIPLNTADGSFDFQAVDPWLIDYVAVYRGDNGMALGGSTLGGVIDLGSTLPAENQDNLLRLSAGSFSTQRGMFSYTSGNESNAFRIRASHFNQDGFRTQNQQRSHRFYLQQLINTQAGWQHHISLFHLNTYAELPSSLSRGLITENPRQSRVFNIFGNFHRDLTLSRLSYQITDNNLEASIFIAQKQLENPVFTYINRDSDDVGFNLSWQQGPHTIKLNTQWGQQNELRRENESGFPGEDRLFRQQDAQTTTASYHYRLPLISHVKNELMLDLAIQAVYAQRDINETFPNTINSNRDYSQINPRIALKYQPRDNVQWFSSLSRSFEAPTFAELNNGNQPGINAPLKAQSADTFQLGTRGFTDFINWDLSLYYSQLDNEFIRFRFPDGATRTTNAKQSIHWGVESLIRFNMAFDVFSAGDKVSLTNNYQYSQFNLDNDTTYGDNHIPGVPEHHLQSRIEYQHPSGWRIMPGIEWIPSAYYVDLANSVKTQNYLLTGLNFSYTQTNDLQWFFDVKNLNNQNHISTTLPIPDAGGTDGNYFYSGEGRAFYAGIKWIF